MSSSNSSVDRVPLMLTGIPADATVTVYDGRDRPVWSGRGGAARTEWLPKGLYTVRVDRLGRMTEHVVRLAEAHTLSPGVPQRYTPAPLEGTASSHEYYSENAAALSRIETSPPIDRNGASGGLFVFIRATSEQAAQQERTSVGSGLVLRDDRGREMTAFDETVTKRDGRYGWVAFSARAAPGFYALHHTGEPSREAALYVFPRLQTQVFVLHHAWPQLETMRVFLARVGRGFHHGDPEANAVDLALDGFQSGIETLTDNDLQRLLGAKCEDPMLGLVGAHALLQRIARRVRMGQKTSVADENLLDLVLGNLSSLLPEAPDVSALQLLAASVVDRPRPAVRFPHPPMLRAGLSAVIDASAESPGLVPEEGLVDDIAPRALADSPWSTWTPLGSSWPAASMRTPPLGPTAAPMEGRPSPTPKEKPRRPRRARGRDASVDILSAERAIGGERAAEDQRPVRSRAGEYEETVARANRERESASEPETIRELARELDLESMPEPAVAAPEPAPAPPAEPDWVQMGLIDVAARAERARRRDDRTTSLSVRTLAQQLGVTPRVVQRAAAGLLQHSEQDLMNIMRAVTARDVPDIARTRALIDVLRTLGR